MRCPHANGCQARETPIWNEGQATWIKQRSEAKILNTTSCSSCSYWSTANRHKNHHAIYQSNQQATYINNLTSISINFTHANQIEQKQVSHSNVQIHITSSIPNENSWSKLQCNLCSTIYLSHMLISRIEGFEISPYECAVLDSGDFEAWKLKTEVQWWLGRWMECVL